MPRFALSSLAVLVAATAAVAQSFSQQCTQALAAVAVDPAASNCLNPSAFVQLALSGSNSSVVQPVNNWLTGMCSAGACSNDTIAAVVTNITTGCSSELASVGLSTGSSQALIAGAQAAYPAVRQVLCLSDGGTNCITKTLQSYEAVVGTLTLSKIIFLALNPLAADIPDNITCSSCTKAAYNVLEQNSPGLVDPQEAQTKCGANFTDGANPAGISQTASSALAADGPKDGGSAMRTGFMSVSSLVGIFSAFVILV